jgi:hypothetical protein
MEQENMEQKQGPQNLEDYLKLIIEEIRNEPKYDPNAWRAPFVKNWKGVLDPKTLEAVERGDPLW